MQHVNVTFVHYTWARTTNPLEFFGAGGPLSYGCGGFFKLSIVEYICINILTKKMRTEYIKWVPSHEKKHDVDLYTRSLDKSKDILSYTQYELRVLVSRTHLTKHYLRTWVAWVCMDFNMISRKKNSIKFNLCQGGTCFACIGHSWFKQSSILSLHLLHVHTLVFTIYGYVGMYN